MILALTGLMEMDKHGQTWMGMGRQWLSQIL